MIIPVAGFLDEFALVSVPRGAFHRQRRFLRVLLCSELRAVRLRSNQLANAYSGASPYSFDAIRSEKYFVFGSAGVWWHTIALDSLAGKTHCLARAS
jgi:hypothetical protein